MRAYRVRSCRDIDSIVPTFAVGKHIPKIIHQTVPDKNGIPVEIRNNMAQIAVTNPNWQYILYDDDDIKLFIVSNYGDKAWSLVNSISPRYGVCLADVFRYLVVYKYGGVYIDTKCRVTQALDTILQEDDQYILSQWNSNERSEGFGVWPDLAMVPGGEFQQWHVISVSGHPFLRAVIKNVFYNLRNYNPWIHGSGQIGVLRTTGPIAYTLAIYPLLSEYNHRFINTDSRIGLEYSIFSNLKHKNLLSTHYTRRTTPIIASSRLGDAIYVVYANIVVFPKRLIGFLRHVTKVLLENV